MSVSSDIDALEGELALVAHDLRGPVSVARGHLRLLLEGLRGPLTEEQRHSVEAIERQAERLDRMIELLEHGEVAKVGAPLMESPLRAEEPFPERPRILVADDDLELLELLREILSDRYDVMLAESGNDALECLRSHQFELAIVDLGLPDIDGFQLAEKIATTAEVPPAFMFLSAQTSTNAKVKGLHLGAADYVTKPFDPDELLARIARIAAAVERERNLRADALTDPLTGLANYRSLAHNLHRELERARRYDIPLSLITVDIDNLKRINDEGGHAAGNEAIVTIAGILKSAIRKFEMVARQGGDELAILLPNTTAEESMQLAERLRHEVSRASVRGRPLSISLGVASREKGDEATDARALVDKSDEALYRAKRQGRNRVSGPKR